ncbi:hypothetical protein GCM10027176_20270 [Actinoallomurus bryophytorum]|uniref:Uncharacterized protein n=1 Tax=Actinoallomurus bryophytorum TaxID=1490222 RepID=A0A543CKR9_9ACTN|nr:hypothetical protein [Actinoallomurus bryophytorum]TQL97696.1 hypothetical protein FB559_3297 [Actinoallomurus bryophytorum]
MSKPTYDPFAVINLVMRELARQNVKTRFSGTQIHDAVPAAEQLLTSFGLTPATPADDIPDRREAPTPS